MHAFFFALFLSLMRDCNVNDGAFFCFVLVFKYPSKWCTSALLIVTWLVPREIAAF